MITLLLWAILGALLGALLVLLFRLPPPPVFLPTAIPVPRPGDDDLETCLTCYCLVVVKNWDEHAEYHDDPAIRQISNEEIPHG